jgi:hypothetical protein
VPILDPVVAGTRNDAGEYRHLSGRRGIMRHNGRGRVFIGAGLLFAGCLLLTACTGTQRAAPAATASASPSRSAPLVAKPATDPPLVAVLPSGPMNCGAWMISATTEAGTMALLSCSGEAGLLHPRVIKLATGGAVLITGLQPSSSLSVTPPGLLTINGSSLTAQRPGTGIITIHNWFCGLLPSGIQPHSCTLARVQAS